MTPRSPEDNATTEYLSLIREVRRRIEALAPPSGRVARPAASALSKAPAAKKPLAVRPARPEFLPAGSDNAASLRQLREEIGDCTRCKLHPSRTHLVFGVGNPNASLMFVGEAPGQDEDLKGEPFVGRAGQLLTKMIQAMGLAREEVYIANILKCRPPGNRNPEPDEVETCSPFLKRQIAIIRPRVICALGSFASQTLVGTTQKISAIRGRFHPVAPHIAMAAAGFGEQTGVAKVMPTYHPAYLLRNAGEKKTVWEDLKKVMAELGLKPGKDGP